MNLYFIDFMHVQQVIYVYLMYSKYNSTHLSN